MRAKRPYKVKYHFEGTRLYDAESGVDTIDDTRPITGLAAYSEECAAHRHAQATSRHGGTAEVFYRDPHDGQETPIRVYQPYETAMAELCDESR